MQSFKEYLKEDNHELSTAKMMAGMYRNLVNKSDVKQVEVKRLKSKFSGAKACFHNAQRLVKSKPGSFYVLGFIFFHGIPIEHAWVKLSTGEYIDSTLDGNDNYYAVLELTQDEMIPLIKKYGDGYVNISSVNRMSK